MTGYLLAALSVLGTFGMTAIGDMVSEEVRDRLDHVPNAILRLAAQRLDVDQRSALYEEVWLADLAYYLRGDKARPVTRLILGTRFAVGILIAAMRMARQSKPRIHSLSILVEADRVRLSEFPGWEWSHESFTQALNEIVKKGEENLANARGVFARRRASAGLRTSCRSRDQLVSAMQEYANNRPQSRPERELPG